MFGDLWGAGPVAAAAACNDPEMSFVPHSPRETFDTPSAVDNFVEHRRTLLETLAAAPVTM
jgi:hypothetical protein